MVLLLLLRVRNRKDIFAHLTGVVSSPNPFQSLSLLSRVLRVTDFTSISPGISQHSIYFKILQWKQIAISQDWLLRTFFEISCHSVAQDCPELLCTTDPPALAFKVVGTTGVHHRGGAWQTLTFLISPQLLAMHVSKKGQAEAELTPYHSSAERKPLQSFVN